LKSFGRQIWNFAYHQGYNQWFYGENRIFECAVMFEGPKSEDFVIELEKAKNGGVDNIDGLIELVKKGQHD